MEAVIRRFSGNSILPFVSDAARLRISVFREFPYLYEGSESSEVDYMQSYVASATAAFVVALAGQKAVGISTGLPLADAEEGFQQPFLEAGIEVSEWFYFGESVLEPGWRGKGIGHRFFDEREAHARELGFRHAAFCSVLRALDHPLRPFDYRPHDAFWAKRGFVKDLGLVARLSWQQIDSEEEEVANELVFWTKDLT
jgi:GNAT superfamily N-acetyltransferase